MTVKLPPGSWQPVGLRLRQFVDFCCTVDCVQVYLYTGSPSQQTIGVCDCNGLVSTEPGKSWIAKEEESGEIDGLGRTATGSGNIDATEEIAKSDGTDPSRIWIHRKSGIARRPGGYSEVGKSVVQPNISVSTNNSKPTKLAADAASRTSSKYVTSGGTTKYYHPIQSGRTPEFGKSVKQSNTRVSSDNSKPSNIDADASSGASSEYVTTTKFRYPIQPIRTPGFGKSVAESNTRVSSDNSKPSNIDADASSGASSEYVTTTKFRYPIQPIRTPGFGKSVAESNTRVSSDNSKPSNIDADASSGASSEYVTPNKFRYPIKPGRTPGFGRSVAQSNTRVSSENAKPSNIDASSGSSSEYVTPTKFRYPIQSGRTLEFGKSVAQSNTRVFSDNSKPSNIDADASSGAYSEYVKPTKFRYPIQSERTLEFGKSVAQSYTGVSSDNSKPSNIAADAASRESSEYVTYGGTNKFRYPIQSGGNPEFGKSVAQSNTRVSSDNSNPSNIDADASSGAYSEYVTPTKFRYPIQSERTLEFGKSVAQSYTGVSSDNSKPSNIAADAASRASSEYVTYGGTNKFRYPIQSGGNPEFGKYVAQSNTRVSSDNSNPSNIDADAFSEASSEYVTPTKFRYPIQLERTPEFGKSFAQSYTGVSSDNSKSSNIAADAASRASSEYVTSGGTNKFRYPIQSGGTPEFEKYVAQSNTRVYADNSKPSNIAENADSRASSEYATSGEVTKFSYPIESGGAPEFGKSVAKSNAEIYARVSGYGIKSAPGTKGAFSRFTDYDD
ncbi:hypothetical protein TNCV_479771 [Trichonephila clavipes]|nr:hypothetical protein TNCV_479771 [Trichonephila clavipes]